jgi:hypothetical protein
MTFADINFGQIGQMHGHMDGQIGQITKTRSFNSIYFAPK